MSILNTLNSFYYNMTLNELRLMNENTIYPNITYNSLLYMDLIAYKENCTVSYLAEALHISKPAVTIKVNELIRQGFVVKTQSEKDRRVYYLSVSPLVENDYQKYDKRLNKAVEKLKEQYQEEELNMFSDMVKLLTSFYTDEE